MAWGLSARFIHTRSDMLVLPSAHQPRLRADIPLKVPARKDVPSPVDAGKLGAISICLGLACTKDNSLDVGACDLF